MELTIIYMMNRMIIFHCKIMIKNQVESIKIIKTYKMHKI